MNTTLKRLFVVMYADQLVTDSVNHETSTRNLYLSIIRDAYPEEGHRLEIEVAKTVQEGGDIGKIYAANPIKSEQMWAASRTAEELLETLLTVYGLLQLGKLEQTIPSSRFLDQLTGVITRMLTPKE